MWFTAPDFIFFLHSRWFQPLRAACPWLSAQAHRMAWQKRDVPAWLRPVYLHHWIGKAIAARLAWLAAHPGAAPYCFPTDSLPCWSKDATLPHERRRLRALETTELLWLWEVAVERLLRIIQTDPGDIGPDRWTQALMGVCGHLAQGYHELARRLGTTQARARLREVLRLYVTWGVALPAEQATSVPVQPAMLPSVRQFPILT